MLDWIVAWLVKIGVPNQFAQLIIPATMFVIMCLVAWLSNYFGKRFVVRFINWTVRQTKTSYDDHFAKHKVFQRLSHLLPAMVFYIMANVTFAGYPSLISLIQSLASIYMVVIVVMVLYALIDSGHSIYETFPIAKDRPMKFAAQVVKVIAGLISGIFILSILLNKSPANLFTGLGAMTAILLLVFKDLILNFVAGIQILTNDLVRVDDWISMPDHHADGDVVEVNLTSIKVRNWDKTFTTIPTADIVTEACTNWRGMRDSGGRRIKRCLYIDASSVHFLNEEEMERLSGFKIIADYMKDKRVEIDSTNKKMGVTLEDKRNSRRLTNIGTFRAYVQEYLSHHMKIHPPGTMTFLIRQLEQTSRGIPLQIYCFAKTVAWAEYEGIQSDVFDHLYAIAPEFGIELYQAPAGLDIRQAASDFRGA